MKKLYLLFFMLLILFIPKTFAVTPYRLDQQVPELNGFTLREVFQNRNIAMPDLTGKTEISAGVYRIYDNNGVTIDYNIYNGEYILNGTTTGNPTTFIPLGVSTYVNGPLVFSAIDVSGTVSHNERPLISYSLNNSVNETFSYWPGSPNTIIPSLNGNFVFGIRRISIINGITYDNLRFKLQLEKGATATPYQVPTNGPYSDIDVSEFNLTPEQIDMYYDYYLEAVEFENRGGMSIEFFLISIFFMYILIMIIGYFTKSKYFYFAGSLLWLVPIFNYTNIFIITTSIIVFLIHLTFIFYSDKDDVFE